MNKNIMINMGTMESTVANKPFRDSINLKEVIRRRYTKR